MQIMHSYSDIIREIEFLKEQIDITNEQIEYWYLDGKGSFKFGANASLMQVDELVETRNKLFERYEEMERAKNRAEKLMKQFEGLEYKIAYLRIVKKMKHKEIAEELNYSETHIRRKWAEMKKLHS